MKKIVLIGLFMLSGSAFAACMAPSQVTSTMAPPVLYQAAFDCYSTGQDEPGAFLFAAAGVYGRYDSMRVKEPLAQRTPDVLKMHTMMALNKTQQDHVMSSVKTMLETPAKKAAACAAMKRLGPPTYKPDYLNAPTVEFDSAKVFSTSLDTYLSCH